MKVLMVSSEGVPFAKTGGLADVVGSLPRELRNKGVDARVIMPAYGGVLSRYGYKMRRKGEITVPLGWRRQYCGILELEHDGIPFYFLDNDYYFKREELYGYDDEAERFAFFSRAVLEALPYLDFTPHILHCHDWHASLVPVFLKTHYREKPFYQKMRTVLTIHNLHYRGIFGKETIPDLLGLGYEYFSPEGLEFYGKVSYLKGGLLFSDFLTTVSRTYAQEIQTPYYGEGLDGILRMRNERLEGIINGIDYNYYNPMTDKQIFQPYRTSLVKKTANKLKLQEMLRFPEDEKIPLVAFVNRLVEQKGLDLIARVLEEILSRDAQVVILGTGDQKYELFLQYMAGRYPDKLSVNIMFDDSLARKIYAGSDIFLMPSLFEPCGTAQLIALRYGSIPVVRETGGLKDTVTSYNERTGKGNGFSFTNYNAHDMLYTVNRALDLYGDRKAWTGLIKNAVKKDFSWSRPAAKYGELYKHLLDRNTGDDIDV